MKIFEDHKIVLSYLGEHLAKNYSFIEKETGLSRDRIILCMKELKYAGYCEFGLLFDSNDYELAGSGHILTDKGVKLKEELGIETKIEDYEIF
jgi:hypothetical protein